MDTKYIAVAVIGVIIVAGGLFLWLSPASGTPSVADTAGANAQLPGTPTNQTGSPVSQQSPSAGAPTTQASQSAAVTSPNEAAKASTMTFPDGLKIQDEVVGTGATAQSGQQVTVNYIGWLADGTKFDASADHGGTFTFNLGAQQVIKGWDQGVVGMKVGGKRKLTIPPELGYGANGMGPIPPNSTLTFEVELVKVN